MNKIKHEEISRDCLYEDLSQNLELIYALWLDKERHLRFAIPILCAAKLEAFINVAGRLKVSFWNIVERKLQFPEKCQIVFAQNGLRFDRATEPNTTAVSIFEIRNSIVHPKMKLARIDEYVSQEQYEVRRSNFSDVTHHLRSDLNPEKVKALKDRTDEFVSAWGPKLLDGIPDYWLRGGSTGSFTFEPERKG